MKIYWFCICEEGHVKVLLRDTNDVLSSEEELCPLNHPAVIVSKKAMADIVEISLRPAAYIDPHTNRIHDDLYYYLVITDHYGGQERVSSRRFKWEEVVGESGILQRFRRANATQAWKYLDMIERSGENHT